MSNRLSVIAALAIAVGSSAAASALEGPKSSFDATYTTFGPAGSSKIRMISDGKGHLRTESGAAGHKIVTIMDYPALKAVTLIEAQKKVVKVTLKNGPEIYDAESAQKNNAKSLGTKIQNGYQCHGWEYAIPGGKSQVWTGDDINYLVKTETTTKKGKAGMDLKTFAKASPGADQFSVPTGYKLKVLRK